MTTTCLDNPPTNVAGYDPTRDAGDCVWSPEHAQRVVRFFEEYLRHYQGAWAGKPFMLAPWQRDYVVTLFGWLRPDGTRRYRESVLFVPRKNGKTALTSGIALYLLGCDREPGAQIYCAAYTQDQATLLYNNAVAMVEQSRRLRRHLTPIESRARIIHTASRSVFRAIPADYRGAHGFSAHGVLFDELHTQRTRDLYDALKSSMGARRQPLMVSMSTAGYNQASLCYELWTYARSVRDGTISAPHFLPCIYEVLEGVDWQDEEVWKKANPNLGQSISLEFLREEYQNALKRPGYENVFRRFYLNQWVGQETRWLSLEDWDACRGELPDVQWRPCYLGVDLSATTDLTAIAAAWPLEDDRVALKLWFFVPGKTAAYREQFDGVPYQTWQQQGYVTLSGEKSIQYDQVAQFVLELSQRYNVCEVAMDPWHAQQVIQQLKSEHLTVVEHRQGYASMSAPSKEFERRILERRLLHDGNPVMRWMVGNVAISQDPAGNIKPNKERSGDRIDGVVAAIMAVGRASLNMSTEAECGSLFIV